MDERWPERYKRWGFSGNQESQEWGSRHRALFSVAAHRSNWAKRRLCSDSCLSSWPTQKTAGFLRFFCQIEFLNLTVFRNKSIDFVQRFQWICWTIPLKLLNDSIVIVSPNCRFSFFIPSVLSFIIGSFVWSHLFFDKSVWLFCTGFSCFQLSLFLRPCRIERVCCPDFHYMLSDADRLQLNAYKDDQHI